MTFKKCNQLNYSNLVVNWFHKTANLFEKRAGIGVKYQATIILLCFYFAFL